MKNRIIKIVSVAVCCLLALGIMGCQNNDNGEKNIFAVEYNGVTVKLGAKADSVLEKLGEPNDKQSSGNCGGLGETYIYSYPAFELTVVDYEDGDKIIDKIELTTDSAETADGIYIGAEKSAVTEAYGDGEESNGALVYEEGDKKMAVGIKNGKVSYIIMYCD